jgi:hypothetical protein
MSFSVAKWCKYKHSLFGQSKFFKKKLQYLVVPKEARNKCPLEEILSIDKIAREASEGLEKEI